MDFRLVKAGTPIDHHNGDVLASTFSPIYAFFFTRLRIEGIVVQFWRKQREFPRDTAWLPVRMRLYPGVYPMGVGPHGIHTGVQPLSDRVRAPSQLP